MSDNMSLIKKKKMAAWKKIEDRLKKWLDIQIG